MANNDIILKMESGDRGAILDGLVSRLVNQRTLAIIYATKFYKDDRIIMGRIKSLLSDNSSVFEGLHDETVSAFAAAALDIAGIQNYDGDNEFVKRLISYNMEL